MFNCLFAYISLLIDDNTGKHPLFRTEKLSVTGKSSGVIEIFRQQRKFLLSVMSLIKIYELRFMPLICPIHFNNSSLIDKIHLLNRISLIKM